MLYLRDPALVRRILLADGWHYVNDDGLRVTDRGVSWTPAAVAAADHPVTGVDRVRVHASKADVLAVEEWAPAGAPDTDRVEALEFPAADRPPPAEAQPITLDRLLPHVRDLRRTLRHL